MKKDLDFVYQIGSELKLAIPSTNRYFAHQIHLMEESWQTDFQETNEILTKGVEFIKKSKQKIIEQHKEATVGFKAQMKEMSFNLRKLSLRIRSLRQELNSNDNDIQRYEKFIDNCEADVSGMFNNSSKLVSIPSEADECFLEKIKSMILSAKIAATELTALLQDDDFIMKLERRNDPSPRYLVEAVSELSTFIMLLVKRSRDLRVFVSSFTGREVPPRKEYLEEEKVTNNDTHATLSEIGLILNQIKKRE